MGGEREVGFRCSAGKIEERLHRQATCSVLDISFIEISNFRYIVSNAFSPPSPGISMLFLQETDDNRNEILNVRFFCFYTLSAAVSHGEH